MKMRFPIMGNSLRLGGVFFIVGLAVLNPMTSSTAKACGRIKPSAGNYNGTLTTREVPGLEDRSQEEIHTDVRRTLEGLYITIQNSKWEAISDIEPIQAVHWR